MKKKKFENPAEQFEGLWRVDSYDFRGFEKIPDDFDKQLEETIAFPIGQRIKFQRIGSTGIPGNIDPVTMKYDGPIGEALRMTLLQPFEKKLCDIKRWDYLCKNFQEDYSAELMIANISNWKHRASKWYLKTWEDIKPIEYGLMRLSKSYSFDVWFGENGDMIIVLIIDGIAKDGSSATTMGIRLKRIKD
ncbi:MAG: hypothetical protein NVS3B3_22920 [Aquirhabdus sp.]